MQNCHLGHTEKSLRFLISVRVTSDPRIGIFSFLFIYYETMSNCSQNCWIDWNSAVLCFKQLSHWGMASISHYTLCMGNWSGSNNRIYMYMYHVFHWLAKKRLPKKKKKKSVPLHRYCGRTMTRNRRLFFWPYAIFFLLVFCTSAGLNFSRVGC